MGAFMMRAEPAAMLVDLACALRRQAGAGDVLHPIDIQAIAGAIEAAAHRVAQMRRGGFVVVARRAA